MDTTRLLPNSSYSRREGSDCNRGLHNEMKKNTSHGHCKLNPTTGVYSLMPKNSRRRWRHLFMAICNSEWKIIHSRVPKSSYRKPKIPATESSHCPVQIRCGQRNILQPPSITYISPRTKRARVDSHIPNQRSIHFTNTVLRIFMG